MKKILLSTFVIAAMASCSQNEIVTENAVPVPISFAPQFGNSVASRGANDLAQDKTLGVYAYNGGTPGIYDGISNSALAYSTDGWYLDTDHYYPSDDSEVSFWAYGPKDETHLSSIDCTSDNGPQFTLTLANTNTDVDVFATQEVKTGKKTSANAIVFPLKRVLAQVKFKAKTATESDATNFDVKINSITIATKGTADYATKAWTNHSNDLTWTVVSAEGAALSNTASDQGTSVNLIPQQAVTFTVNAHVYDKGKDVLIGDQTATLELDNTTGNEYLAQGNSYTYTISVAPNVGKITFGTPTLDPWNDAAGTIEVGTTAP